MAEYVYLLTSHKKFKIGYSAHPRDRLTWAKSVSDLPLRLTAMVPGGRALEKVVLDYFRDFNLHGEWFFPATKIVETFWSHPHYFYPGETGRPVDDPNWRCWDKYAEAVADWELKHWYGDKRSPDEEQSDG